MKRWFRFYEEAINDDKVRCLPTDAMRWHWVVLLAVSSKYGGEIPSLLVAAENLRVSKAKAAEIVATVARAGLLDRVEGRYFRAHNWEGRQPTDATAAERKRRQRQKERDGECDQERDNRDSHAVTTVTVTHLEGIDKIDDDGDARAREPLISEGANRLADEITKIAGHDLKFVPPSWCGAAYRTQIWLNQGWPEELILQSVRSQAAKKRDGPAKSIQYFEPGIASAIAKANQPLPTANVTEIRGRNEASAKSGYAAIDRVIDRLEEVRSEMAGEPAQDAVLSLPARSVSGA